MKVTKLIFYTKYYVFIHAACLFYAKMLLILETKEIIIMFDVKNNVCN
jgi:hypothetical protein